MNDYEFTLADADAALSFISPDLPRDEWATIAMALKAEFGEDAFGAFDQWSEGGQSYKAADAKATWRSIKATGGVTIASLIAQAKAGGWQPAKVEPDPQEKIRLMKVQAERREKVAAQQAKADQQHAAKVANCLERSAKIWQALPDGGTSDYLSAKQVRAWGVRFSRGAMVVPVRDASRALVGLQFIAGDGSKKFLTGTQKRGSWHLLGDVSPRAPIAVAEGYATAASIRQATGWAVAVAFDAGNLLPVTEALFAQHPEAMFLICADDDHKTAGNTGKKAAKKAAEHCSGRVVVPEFAADAERGSDWNDLHVQAGLDEVKKQLMAATQRPCETPAPPASVEVALTLEIVLKRFALAMPDAKVWDFECKQLLNKQAAKSFMGPLWDQWLKDPARQSVQQLDLLDDIAAAKAEGRGGLSDALKRFVYLAGTTDVWDRLRRERVNVNALRLQLADDYEDWLKHPHRHELHYSDLLFDPKQVGRDGVYINMFRGLPLQPVRNDAACVGIQQLVFSLCNKDKDDWRWLMSWLALPLQQVGAKMATAVLMHSNKQGAGKSLFFDGVMRHVYGDYSATVSQHELEDKYTVWRSQKLYAVFEEIFARGQKYDYMGLVKQMITGETFRVEQKFVTGWEETNCMNSVFLSNEVQPMYIEDEDRRFFVVWPRWKLSDELQQQVAHEIANGGIEAFYAYLLAWDLKDFNTHTKPPRTAAKERLINFGRAGWELFALQWQAGETDAPFVPVRNKDLYKYYERWCKGQGERPISANKFTGLVKTLDWLRSRAGVHYDSGHTSAKGRFFLPRDVELPEGKTQGEWLGDCVERWDKLLSATVVAGDFGHAA
ncbi:MAG: DUF5906 domain-containing protein [Candidatus Reddybacter sp.]